VFCSKYKECIAQLIFNLSYRFLAKLILSNPRTQSYILSLDLLRKPGTYCTVVQVHVHKQRHADSVAEGIEAHMDIYTYTLESGGSDDADHT
jgi:hypothetical protein